MEDPVFSWNFCSVYLKMFWWNCSLEGWNTKVHMYFLVLTKQPILKGSSFFLDADWLLPLHVEIRMTLDIHLCYSDCDFFCFFIKIRIKIPLFFLLILWAVNEERKPHGWNVSFNKMLVIFLWFMLKPQVKSNKSFTVNSLCTNS